MRYRTSLMLLVWGVLASRGMGPMPAHAQAPPVRGKAPGVTAKPTADGLNAARATAQPAADCVADCVAAGRLHVGPWGGYHTDRQQDTLPLGIDLRIHFAIQNTGDTALRNVQYRISSQGPAAFDSTLTIASLYPSTGGWLGFQMRWRSPPQGRYTITGTIDPNHRFEAPAFRENNSSSLTVTFGYKAPPIVSFGAGQWGRVVNDDSLPANEGRAWSEFGVQSVKVTVGRNLSGSQTETAYWTGSRWVTGGSVAHGADLSPTEGSLGVSFARRQGLPGGAHLPEGRYEIRAHVTDKGGRRAWTKQHARTWVDRTPPAVLITSPPQTPLPERNNHILPDDPYISTDRTLPAIAGTAADQPLLRMPGDSGVVPGGIGRVDVSIQRVRDGWWWNSGRWFPRRMVFPGNGGGSWTTSYPLPRDSTLPPGKYVIYVEGYDKAGNVSKKALRNVLVPVALLPNSDPVLQRRVNQ